MIDEATTDMARSHGRARRGERLVAPVRHGRWQTTTFLCGLREGGLVAPLVLDSAINGAAFLAYIEQMLRPVLQAGEAVIYDNLARHNVAGCARRSKPAAQLSSICRPTAPT